MLPLPPQVGKEPTILVPGFFFYGVGMKVTFFKSAVQCLAHVSPRNITAPTEYSDSRINKSSTVLLDSRSIYKNITSLHLQQPMTYFKNLFQNRNKKYKYIQLKSGLLSLKCMSCMGNLFNDLKRNIRRHLPCSQVERYDNIKMAIPSPN